MSLPALLGADEVLEVDRVADEEDRRVVADHVVVALGGVELQREPAQVPPQVRAAALPGHGGEPGRQLGRRVRLEHRRLGVGGHVLGDLDPAERAAALGVRLPLRDPLPVPLGHLLDQVAVLQQDRAARTDGQRILIALDRDAGIRRLRQVLGSHRHVSFGGWNHRTKREEPQPAPSRQWPLGGRSCHACLVPGLVSVGSSLAQRAGAALRSRRPISLPASRNTGSNASTSLASGPETAAWTRRHHPRREMRISDPASGAARARTAGPGCRR